MTTKITIEVPENVNYKAHIKSRSTGLRVDGTVVEIFNEDTVLPGEFLVIHVWTGYSVQISEIPL